MKQSNQQSATGKENLNNSLSSRKALNTLNMINFQSSNTTIASLENKTFIKVVYGGRFILLERILPFCLFSNISSKFNIFKCFMALKEVFSSSRTKLAVFRGHSS